MFFNYSGGRALMTTAPASASSVFAGGVAYEASTGALHVSYDTPASTDPRLGGVACKPSGEVYVATGTPVESIYIGGLRVSASGQLYVDDSSSPVAAVNGVPATVAGAVASDGGNVIWRFEADALSLVPTRGSGTPTFDRNDATATRMTIARLIEIGVAADAARYDYTWGAPMLLFEPPAINRALHNRDLTNAAWVKGVTMTAAKDQIGVDGVANSASKLTGGAVLATNTCLQTVTLASSSRVMSAYVKRVTGTGTVEMTTNGGTNWTDLSLGSNNEWTRYSLPAATVTNPSFGFRIATSGDAIAVDLVQNETDVLTSAIATAAAAVTRNGDDWELLTASIPGFSQNPRAIYVRGISHAGSVTGSRVPECMLLTKTDFTNYDAVYRNTGTESDAKINTATVDQMDVDTGTDVGNEHIQRMLVSATNDGAAVQDGGTVQTDATVTVGAVDKAVLGSLSSGLSDLYWRGWIAEAEIRVGRPTNTLIQVRTTPKEMLVATGDSITQGTSIAAPDSGYISYASLYFDSSTRDCRRIASNGAGLSTLLFNSGHLDSLLPPVGKRGSRNYYLSVLIGTNGLALQGAAGFLAALEGFCDARRTAGWKVILCTILPATEAAISGHNAERATANATIRTWVGTHADYICDFAAHATMGPDAAASNTALYSDGIHPTAAGHELLKEVYAAAVPTS